MINQLESKGKEGLLVLLKVTFHSFPGGTEKNTINLNHGIWTPGQALNAVSPG